MASERFTLDIRATNGASWVTDDFRSNMRVDHVRRKAVEHFIEEGAMAAGDYLLAVVEGGATRDLIDAQKLDAAGVVDRSVLVLIPRQPQVDG
jgi:hypothetical protein